MITGIRRTCAIVIVMFLSLSLGYQVHALGPSVSECAKNPELEGCTPADPDSENDQNTDGAAVTDSGSDTSIVWNIIKLVFALLLVLALIYGLLKFFNKRSKSFTKNRTMENLGGLTLAPNKSLQAVRIGEQIFIVGVGDSVEVITEITEQSTRESFLHQENHDLVNKGISHLLKQNKGRTDDAAQSAVSPFKQLFEQQLNEMKNKRKNVTDKRKGVDPDE
ncbi:flagellar biosynthetic protein FliO [Halobacillus naozhouensis]|uniref:Flagellar biosynthetic protein FliO n=1 Tax=Halobacillus naozhouensis TaxID=554880 RepID=A0ABY8J5P7_9BACI|nr:flagellar biosynthetic protein FliO [Halobacillus naozhouensis]WFT76748.1 flagellar biosynthetic protein FliO [Halobacillus naozhouensis]